MDTELRRFESYFFQAKSQNDPAQVPLSGALLTPTRQGATVLSSVDFYEQEVHDVTVADAGLVRVGDTLFTNFDTNVELLVVEISASRQSLTLQNLGGYISVSAGARLRPANDLPTLYGDPRGVQVLSGGTATVNSAGFGYFYTPTTLVDVTATGGGLSSPRLYADKRCGWLRGAESWRNANDYPSIQAAIDSLPEVGGTVFIPAGFHDLSETLYTPCDRPCHLVGEGSSRTGVKGTVLRWTGNTGMLRLRGDDSSVRGLTLRMMASGTASSEHEGYGIFVGRRDITDAHPHPGTSPTQTEYTKGGSTPLYRSTLEDVVVLDAPGWGLTIPGYLEQSDAQPEYALVRPDVGLGGGTLSFWIDVTRVQLVRSRKYGALFTGGGCTTLRFRSGALLQQGVGQTIDSTCYAHLRGTVMPVFRDWIFEGCGPAGDATGLTRPWVVVHGCESVSFESCWFENDPHFDAQGQLVEYDPQYFLHLRSTNRSVTLRQLHLVRAGENKGMLRCLYCADDGVEAMSIEQPYAISTTPLTQDSAGRRTYRDSQAFVLNGNASPVDGNGHISVRSAGVAHDVSGQVGASWVSIPLRYASVPSSANVSD